MHISQQFSIFMVNKPGVLGNLLDAFAKARINIIAITMTDSVEHGVMRVIFENSKKAREVLSRLNVPYNETDVLCLTLTNKAGALASVVKKLATNHISISYAYCTAGAKGGRTTGVLKVADVKNAMKLLEPNRGKATKSKAVIKRSRSSRK